MLHGVRKRSKPRARSRVAPRVGPRPTRRRRAGPCRLPESRRQSPLRCRHARAPSRTRSAGRSRQRLGAVPATRLWTARPCLPLRAILPVVPPRAVPRAASRSVPSSTYPRCVEGSPVPGPCHRAFTQSGARGGLIPEALGPHPWPGGQIPSPASRAREAYCPNWFGMSEPVRGVGSPPTAHAAPAGSAEPGLAEPGSAGLEPLAPGRRHRPRRSGCDARHAVTPGACRPRACRSRAHPRRGNAARGRA